MTKSKLSKTKIEGVRKIAHKNVRVILKKWGFRGQDLGERIVGICPVPHDKAKTPNDNPTAFSWDFTRQMWQCFTHNCHVQNGSDIFALVQRVKVCNFREAVQYILDVVDKGIDEIKDIDSAEAQRLEQVIRKRAQLVRHNRMEEDTMRHLKASTYFQRRGFSDQVVEEFRCNGQWHKPGTCGENRAIVPVYDPLDGFLVAFTCRLLDDSLITKWRPKWSHCLNFAAMRKKSSERTDEERFHASSVLYNLHRARKYMGEDKTIIIVEGPGDVMRMWEAGLKNTVAVLGTGFGKHRRTLLHKVGVRRVVTVLDGDEAGQEAQSSVEKLCRDYFDVVMLNLEDGKDPGDYEPGQLRLIFKEYLC